MPDLTARIAEILRHDGWTCEYHEPVSDAGECSGCDDSHARTAQHIAEAAEQHYRPRIETVEQLDGLPEFSIVGLRMPKRDNVSRHLYAIEKDCGWLGVASTDDLSRTEIASILAAEGPAVVLWSPGSDE